MLNISKVSVNNEIAHNRKFDFIFAWVGQEWIQNLLDQVQCAPPEEPRPS